MLPQGLVMRPFLNLRPTPMRLSNSLQWNDFPIHSPRERNRRQISRSPLRDRPRVREQTQGRIVHQRPFQAIREVPLITIPTNPTRLSAIVNEKIRNRFVALFNVNTP